MYEIICPLLKKLIAFVSLHKSSLELHSTFKQLQIYFTKSELERLFDYFTNTHELTPLLCGCVDKPTFYSVSEYYFERKYKEGIVSKGHYKDNHGEIVLCYGNSILKKVYRSIYDKPFEGSLNLDKIYFLEYIINRLIHCYHYTYSSMVTNEGFNKRTRITMDETVGEYKTKKINIIHCLFFGIEKKLVERKRRLLNIICSSLCSDVIPFIWSFLYK
jgi:hypothetical protein